MGRKLIMGIYYGLLIDWSRNLPRWWKLPALGFPSIPRLVMYPDADESGIMQITMSTLLSVRLQKWTSHSITGFWLIVWFVSCVFFISFSAKSPPQKVVLFVWSCSHNLKRKNLLWQKLSWHRLVNMWIVLWGLEIFINKLVYKAVNNPPLRAFLWRLQWNYGLDHHDATERKGCHHEKHFELVKLCTTTPTGTSWHSLMWPSPHIGFPLSCHWN